MSPRTPNDTIVARATAAGRAGVAIVRVSGPASREIARALSGAPLEPRRAVRAVFRDAAGEPIDDGLQLCFPAPRSFTGEDVVELHGHGGAVVTDMLIERVVELGARLARPGEFSLRAFLNDRMDLVQAEAVADLIDSRSRTAARAALRSLAGEFSARVDALVEMLTGTRVWVEAAIDFPDEEIDFLSDAGLTARLDALADAFAALGREAGQGRLLTDGLTLVIAGPPNAGKSSLLNRLAGAERAIVTDIPGTTRDVLREQILVDGLPVQVLDTAGLRDTADPVEREGLVRAREALAEADHALVVLDVTDDPRGRLGDVLRDWPEGLDYTVVLNKLDLAPTADPVVDGPAVVRLSARTGTGLDRLRERLVEVAGYAGGEAGTFSARRRHLDALDRAAAHLAEGRRQLEETRAGELLAEELRLAQVALGEITGELSADDLLGRIFGSFCIGK